MLEIDAICSGVGQLYHMIRSYNLYLRISAEGIMDLPRLLLPQQYIHYEQHYLHVTTGFYIQYEFRYDYYDMCTWRPSGIIINYK